MLQKIYVKTKANEKKTIYDRSAMVMSNGEKQVLDFRATRVYGQIPVNPNEFVTKAYVDKLKRDSVMTTAIYPLEISDTVTPEARLLVPTCANIKTRIFQVKTEGETWENARTFEVLGDELKFTSENKLNPKTEYQWRYFDTDWSNEYSFITTGPEYSKDPTIKSKFIDISNPKLECMLPESEDIHTLTEWRILDKTCEVIWQSESSSTSVILPPTLLKNGEIYAVMCRIQRLRNGWSNWVLKKLTVSERQEFCLSVLREAYEKFSKNLVIKSSLGFPVDVSAPALVLIQGLIDNYSREVQFRDHDNNFQSVNLEGLAVLKSEVFKRMQDVLMQKWAFEARIEKECLTDFGFV